MIPSNGKANATLYEQVLDFARKEIEDASSQMEELRRALHLVEARVEAAKSVYESVAARLNLEDELEDEVQLGMTELSHNPSVLQQNAPPSFVPKPQSPAFEPPPVANTYEEPPVFAPEPQAAPPAPPPPVAKESEAPPVFAPEPTAPAPAPQQSAPPPVFAPEPPKQAPAPQSNGASDGFSMDLIRKHLEARERAAQKASQAPAKRPETPSEPPVQAPVQAKAPPPPPPAPKTEAPAASQPAQGGFPGLSEADRALIGEYLRSKRD
jgi:hypothetical protein